MARHALKTLGEGGGDLAGAKFRPAKFGAERIWRQVLNATENLAQTSQTAGQQSTDFEWRLFFPTGLWSGAGIPEGLRTACAAPFSWESQSAGPGCTGPTKQAAGTLFTAANGPCHRIAGHSAFPFPAAGLVWTRVPVVQDMCLFGGLKGGVACSGRTPEGIAPQKSAGAIPSLLHRRGICLRGFCFGGAKIRRGKFWNWSLQMKGKLGIRPLAVASGWMVADIS